VPDDVHRVNANPMHSSSSLPLRSAPQPQRPPGTGFAPNPIGVRGLLTLGLLLAIALTPFALAAEQPVVTVTGGQVRRRLLADGPGAVFRGLPFAQPPVGELRWREPQPVAGWSGVREADHPGPPAAQAAFGWNDTFAAAGREDCLYLDVWTPAFQPPAHLPVMVWFHGGGNVAGAGGADPLYEGTALIRRGVVLVIVEYRVGLFGFFAHPELTHESPHHASGNYGIMDQIAALQWVRDNIARFGGDPGNVTIFGQSAGAIDVVGLLTSPPAAGLFHRAIAQSGAWLIGLPTPTLAEGEQAGVRTAAKLGAPAPGSLRFLRSLSAATLLQGIEKVGMTPPNVDGWVFTESPGRVLAAGRGARVPLLIGNIAIEFAASGGLAEIQKQITSTFGPRAAQALALYGLTGASTPPAADPLYGDLVDQWGTDAFRAACIIEGEWQAAAGNSVWEYQFDRAIPPRPKAGHSGDLPYVFGNLYAGGSQGGEFQEVDRRLSETVQTYWTNFARAGDPNGPSLPSWPKHDGQTRRFLEFTPEAKVAAGVNQRGPICDLFRELLAAGTQTPP